MTAQKIPFEKAIAGNVLKTCNLHIAFCKEWSKNQNRSSEFLTLAELEKLKGHIESLYYNEKVELLEVEK